MASKQKLMLDEARVEVHALEQELELSRGRLRAQAQYSVALQKLLAALKLGHDLPDVRSHAPHAYDQARAIRDEMNRLRETLTEVGDIDYNIAIDERDAALEDVEALRAEVEQGKVWQAENAHFRTVLGLNKEGV